MEQPIQQESSKKCPACAELINEAAKKCKHCGELLDTTFISSSVSEKRKVGIALGFGILFIPAIFSWFTLRKGHSQNAKLVSFAWLTVVLLIYNYDPSSKPKVKTSSFSSSAAPQPTAAAVVKKFWELRYYVDKFGDYTKKGYLINSEKISGTFSNSATKDSPLNVNLMVNNPREINIMLYEYARENPVKSYGEKNYKIYVKDNSGKQHNLSATNYSDRLSLTSSSSKKLHDALLQGGQLTFMIEETEYGITEYKFTISNSDNYKETITQLPKK